MASKPNAPAAAAPAAAAAAGNPYLERIHPYAPTALGRSAAETAQGQWAEKRWVWVADKEEGYVAAHIVAEAGDNVTVELGNGQVGGDARPAPVSRRVALICSHTRRSPSRDAQRDAHTSNTTASGTTEKDAAGE